MAYRRRKYNRRPMRRPMRRQRRRAPRKYRVRRGTRLLKTPTSFPGRMRAALTFCNQGYDGIAAAGIKDWVIATKRQPFSTPASASECQGFDQYRAIYYNYRVLGIKIRCRMKVANFPTNTGINVMAYWSPEATKVGSRLGVAQNRFTHSVLLGANASQTTWRTFVRPWTVLGMTYKEWVNEAITKADFTSDPGYQSFYHINLWNSGNDVNLNWEVQGKIYFEFSDARTLLDS